MSDVQTPAPGRRRWLKILGLTAASAAVLVVALYFVLTSAAFLKGVILPRVSSALHATVTVEDASLSPFSSVSLKGLKVTTKDGATLLQADEVRTGYSLMGMLGGTIKVDEVRVINAAVEITVAPDGKSNLDPLLASSSTSAPATKPAKAPQLDIKNIALQNAKLRYVQTRKDGSRIVSEVANVNFTLDQLRNGQASRLTLAADLKTEAGQTPGAANNDLVQARLDATLNFSLSPDLLPKELGLKLNLAVNKAQGSYADLTGLTATLAGDVTPTDIKQFALDFAQNGQPLGKIHASGPLVLEKREGKVKVEISAIDRKVLNFVGAKSGLDFGNTRIDSTSEISLAVNGRIISATGKLTAQQLSIKQSTNAPTVPLDLAASYDVTVDQTAQSALLNTFTLTGTQQQRPLLRAALTQPMSISWSTNASTNAMGDAAFDLAVTDLNLADWSSFTADLAPSGKANVKLNVLSQLGGQKFTAKLDARVDDFAATVGSNKLQNAAIELRADALLESLKQVTLNDLKFGLALKGQPTLLVGSKGTYNVANGEADLQASLDVWLARALALAPVPGMDLKDGKVKFTGRVTQSVKVENKINNTVQTVAGDLALTELTGQFQNFKLDRLGVTVNTDVVKSNALVQLRTLHGQLTQAANAGGAFDISGGVNLATTNAQFAVKLTDVNQNFLAPFAAPSLNGGQLASISINASLAAAYDPAGASSVKGGLQLTNLLVSDPKKQLPETPLSARVALDGSMRKQMLDLRQLLLALSQTPRAKNELTLSGKVDLTDTNAAKLNLKLAAESLDVTPFYDLFDNPQKKADEKKPAEPAKPADANTEPTAMKLPLRDSTVDVNIGKFFLREVAVSNLLAAVKVDGGKVAVQPLQLTLNGAPVSAAVNLNLGVPGYEYDVNLGAQGIPVEPLADSFSPTYRGQAKGKVIADVRVKGAGITGENLQRNLIGGVNLSLTNANIELVGPKIKAVLTPITLLLGITEVLKSPLDFVNANIQLGGGQINVQGVDVHSAAFLANVSGVIPIEKVLTNSPLNLPVKMSLTRSVAKKFAFVGNQGDPYVTLPHFATVSGTLGNPGAKTDKAVIAGLLATGVAGNITGKAGSILGGVGNILTGGKAPAKEESPSTNAPPASTQTNKASNPLDNLLNPFFKKKK
ncbi:MAG: AsmA family protein [Verrucomicrobia bacterium]|nr:AsmA family protein [Verrucomicrobiota bacterium]